MATLFHRYLGQQHRTTFLLANVDMCTEACNNSTWALLCLMWTRKYRVKALLPLSNPLTQLALLLPNYAYDALGVSIFQICTCGLWNVTFTLTETAMSLSWQWRTQIKWKKNPKTQTNKQTTPRKPKPKQPNLRLYLFLNNGSSKWTATWSALGFSEGLWLNICGWWWCPCTLP